jgi:hypothetical protein
MSSFCQVTRALPALARSLVDRGGFVLLDDSARTELRSHVVNQVGASADRAGGGIPFSKALGPLGTSMRSTKFAEVQ